MSIRAIWEQDTVAPARGTCGVAIPVTSPFGLMEAGSFIFVPNGEEEGFACERSDFREVGEQPRPAETGKHLQERPDEWASATDEEWVAALLDRQPFVDPRFMNYAQGHRPHCLRRSLLLHQDMGGYLGAPARRWLKTGRTGR